MLTHIIPAASFTVATTAPSLLSRVTDGLQWFADRPTFVVTFLLTLAVLSLITWAFRRDLAPVRVEIAPEELPVAITAADLVPRGER